MEECKPLNMGQRTTKREALRRELKAERAVGRCRLTVSKPVLKASMASALEAIVSLPAFDDCFQFQRAALQCGHHATRHGRLAAAEAREARCGGRQGLTLVHIFAQSPEPSLSLKPAKYPATWDRECSR